MTRAEKLADLLEHAQVTLSYWDGPKFGVTERDLTDAERKIILKALQNKAKRPDYAPKDFWTRGLP